MAMADEIVQVDLKQLEDYRFAIRFGDNLPELIVDEPAPTGAGAGPSPLQLLAASVGNCLCASLLFALRKFKHQPEPITCTASAVTGRNEQGRLRVSSIKAVLTLGVPGRSLAHIDRVLDQFEAFCTVTQSVGLGIPITVEVWDSTGLRLK